MIEIVKETARRFLLLKHGLLGEYKFYGKEGIVDYITQAGCIQFDPIDVCGKNHELVLQSRVKDFSKNMVHELLYKDRVLVDWFDKNMSICLIKDLPYFEYQRVRARESSRSKKEVDEVAYEVMGYIEEHGPVSSSDLQLNNKVDWGWAPTTLARAVLDTLYYRGDLVIHHKKNTRKFYDLAERHIDSDILEKCRENRYDEHEILAWNVLRRIKSVGMLHLNASYAFIGIRGLKAKSRAEIYKNLHDEKKITEIKVEGIASPFYYCADDMDIMERATSSEKLTPRIEFLAPLDNLLWDRSIISELFDFNYKWEVYTPKAQRKFGHYVLPVLYGENFVGRIELIRNKKLGKFEDKIWLCENSIISKDDIREKVETFGKVMY